ncbi:metalloendopeptidase [Amphritea sp. 1_MG-2023]|uniref:zinc ribbon-containing protein n=1 Tax=Amphritea sp. 1_MG-2023 TaxID=3062670 RepID=UPI0026E3B44B|nr:metalloendopeptidase [Amphritea sp. 1_MG-2023]MDO6565045.1 metalloendopeptidase [Amphritea sp. 1_MG-2023]
MSNKGDNEHDVKGLSEQYDRVLDRLRQDIASAEHWSWDYLQEKIEAAVALELAAEDMTRDEMDLLSAYLKRDLKQLGYYAHETGEGVAAWLNFDLDFLEQTVATQLMDLADRTRIGITELQQRLAEGDDQYAAGDIAAPGTFSCVACGESVVHTATSRLEACPQCGSETFTRQSAPWGDE